METKSYFKIGVVLSICLSLFSCQDESADLTPIIPQGNSEGFLVSFDEAEEIAGLIVSSGGFDAPDIATAKRNQIQNKKKERKIKNAKTYKDNKHRDAFFVFNYEDNEGFSIVSADKRMVPILAESDENLDFDISTENPGLNHWMESMQEHITQLRDDEDYRTSYMNSEDYPTDANGDTNFAYGWETQMGEPMLPCSGDCGGGSGGGGSWSPTSYGPLTNRWWGQKCGFNDFSPAKSNGPCGRAPAGCGPVAVGQVLWYYRNRIGSLSYNGIPVNFNNMPRALFNGQPGDAPDLARLMRFIGDWIIIDWTAKYAMALPSKIPTLFQMLGFSSTLRDLNHSVVKTEIINGRPVIFKARTSGALGISFNHHIWVCDGFRSSYNSNQYYMDWGWNGGGNGWYHINNWQANGSSSNYDKDRKMIVIS